MRIRNKLIIILLVFSFIPFLSLGIIEITKDRKILREQIGNHSLELSRSLMRHIDGYLYSKYINIQGWTKNKCLNKIVFGDKQGDISQFLVGLSEIHDEYYYINCLNTDGHVVASNNVDLKGRDMCADAGFKEALKGNSTMQDVAFSETAGEYAIIMSTPVWDIPGQSEIIGVLTVALKWDMVTEMITNLMIGGREQTIANHIMLLNKDSVVISCFDKNEIFSKNLIEIGIKSAKYAQEHKEGFLTEISEHDLNSFSTYTYSREYKDLPHLDWNLVLYQDPKEVFAVIGLSKKTIIITLSGTFVLLIIISFLFANRISKPILAIVSAARAIGKGDLNTRVPVKSNDEMGLLSASFNEMVDDLKKFNNELCESEEQNREVLRTALDGFWVTDTEGRILEVNDAYCNLTGYSREELLKMCVSDVEALEKPEDTKKHIQQLIKAGDGRFESKHRCKDGRIIDIDVSANCVNVKGGRFFVFIRDITERKKIEEALLQTEKLRAMGMMTSGVAHDFNNILAIISGHTQLLEGNYKEDKELTDIIRTIHKAAKDGAKIVQRMRQFTKMERDTSKFVSVDIKEVLEEAIGFLKPRWMNIAIASGKPFDMDMDGIKEIPSILGNPSELREAFINIINNAMDAMSKGGCLSFRTWSGKDTVIVSITDTGDGMPEEVKKKIFDPFFTTKRAEGSGLGMSEVYGIVTRHGGEIDVSSEVGKGTTFTLKFPIGTETIQEKILPEHGRKITTRKLRILVIDDEKDICNILNMLFSRDGHDVKTVTSGKEGVDLIKSEEFDLVLSDLVMPGLSGHDVIQALDELDKRPKVGLVTGWKEEVEGKDKEELNVDFIIRKPFDIPELLKQINDLFET